MKTNSINFVAEVQFSTVVLLAAGHVSG
jgi:hypothetical protein